MTEHQSEVAALLATVRRLENTNTQLVADNNKLLAAVEAAPSVERLEEIRADAASRSIRDWPDSAVILELVFALLRTRAALAPRGDTAPQKEET